MADGPDTRYSVYYRTAGDMLVYAGLRPSTAASLREHWVRRRLGEPAQTEYAAISLTAFPSTAPDLGLVYRRVGSMKLCQ